MDQSAPFCLGIEFLGRCNYNPHAPGISYFSIGEAVAAVTILFTLYQFIKPIYRFRLSVGVFALSHAYILIIAATAFVLIAAATPYLPLAGIPVVGYPVFWEFSAGLIIVSSLGALLWKASRPVKFTRRNYQSFLAGCGWLVTKGDRNDLIDLTRDVMVNAKSLFEATGTFRQYEDMSAFRQFSEREKLKFAGYAIAVLKVLSDERFCHVAVCHSPGCAIAVFESITENKFYWSGGGYALVQGLVRQAMENEDSIFYREKEYSGLGHFKHFTKAAFGDYKLIESRYRPLNAWYYRDWEKITEAKIERLNSALETALEGYFEEKDFWQKPFALHSAYEIYGDIARLIAWRSKKSEDATPPASDSHMLLHNLCRGLGSSIEIVCRNYECLPPYKSNSAKYDKMHDPSIYGVMAQAVYDVLEGLSYARDDQDTARGAVVSLWHDIFLVSSEEPAPISEIRKRLEVLIFSKLEENFKGYHPPLLWLMILLTTLRNPINAKSITEKFEKKFFEFFAKKFQAALQTDKRQTVLEMLPDNVRYIEVSNEMSYTYVGGAKAVVSLGSKPSPT